MKHLLALSLSGLLALSAVVVQDEAPEEPPVRSRVETTRAGERILVHEVTIHAPVAEVWKAHTTEEGWTAWSSPLAKIDLRVGGTILTHYDKNAKIGDPGTNTLHIVNYVPERVLTLRADVSQNWPEVMKEDADKMSNVILFEPIDDDTTRLVSYGIGYRDTPEYDDLMDFFIEANGRLYAGLIQRLEK